MPLMTSCDKRVWVEGEKNYRCLKGLEVVIETSWIKISAHLNAINLFYPSRNCQLQPPGMALLCISCL